METDMKNETIKSIEVKNNKLSIVKNEADEYIVIWEKNDKVIESLPTPEFEEATQLFDAWVDIEKDSK